LWEFVKDNDSLQSRRPFLVSAQATHARRSHQDRRPEDYGKNEQTLWNESSTAVP